MAAMTTQDCVLTILPGSDDSQRIVVAHCHGADGVSKISLRQQSWADGIGWYDQKSLDLDPEQLGLLRQALGWGGGSAKRTRSAEPVILAFPGVVRTESA